LSRELYSGNEMHAVMADTVLAFHAAQLIDACTAGAVACSNRKPVSNRKTDSRFSSSIIPNRFGLLATSDDHLVCQVPDIWLAF
jgi:hypothetical protein